MNELKKPERDFPVVYVYVVSAIVILGLLVWSFVRSMEENDTRQASVEMPGQGFVTISFSTDPYPPLPSGTVQLNLMGMNSRNLMVDLGPEIPFTFGPVGSESPQGRGSAAPLGDGNYQADVQFIVPGTYWLLFDLGSGRTVRFQIRVEPAQ
ncbi:MAG TPA: hypothetical protein VMN57_12725 [Anaerolineales bacterium]|nr:hypothetical protein [Anaerolineales bacterium]